MFFVFYLGRGQKGDGDRWKCHIVVHSGKFHTSHEIFDIKTIVAVYL